MSALALDRWSLAHFVGALALGAMALAGLRKPVRAIQLKATTTGANCLNWRLISPQGKCRFRREQSVGDLVLDSVDGGDQATA